MALKAHSRQRKSSNSSPSGANCPSPDDKLERELWHVGRAGGGAAAVCLEEKATPCQ